MKNLLTLLLAFITVIPTVNTPVVQAETKSIESVHINEEFVSNLPFQAKSQATQNLTITTADYGYLRPQLSSVEMEIYDALTKYSITADNNGVGIAFPVSTQEEVDTLWNKYSSCYSRAMLAYMFDYLESMYFNYINSYGCAAEIDGNDLVIYFYYGVSEYYKDEYKTQADAILNDVVKNATGNRQEQIIYLHDWIVEHCEYDYLVASGQGTDEEDYFSHNAIGCLLKGKGVCETYAKTFKILCKKLNIPCIYAISDDHAFNYVKMDEENWYMIDCTWDDTTNSKDYFLISNQPYIDISHTPLVFQYPATPTKDFEIHIHHYVLLTDIEPTCTSKGYKMYHCPECDELLHEHLDPLEHDYKFIKTVEPACSHNGYNLYICNVCQCEYEEDLGFLPHDIVDTIIPPTIGACGYTLHTCRVCGYVSWDNFTDPLPEEPETVTERFSDVVEGAWYVPFVQSAVDQGLMSGYTNTTLFGVEDTVTRAQMVQVLYNMSGKPAVTNYAATAKFSDVYSGAWYEDAVNWAYNNGITVGMGDVFGADTALTRAQMVTFFRNYAKFTGKSVDESIDITKYVDYKDVEEWAKLNMAWAVSIDLISGADINGTKYLQPLGNATRAQLATVLTKYCDYYSI